MKKAFVAAMALSLAFATAGYAKKASTGSTSSEIETGMAGKIGVGFDTIPGASAGASAPGFSQPNALDLRYWSSDRIAWEGLLALSIGSTPGGTDAAGKPVNNGTANFGLGVGMNYVIKKPFDNFLVKVIGKASYASAGTAAVTAGTTVSSANSTIALSGHIGFEAFVPAWPALSLEGSVGVGLSSQSSSSSVAASTASSSSSFGFEGGGFTPLNVAAHFYF